MGREGTTGQVGGNGGEWRQRFTTTNDKLSDELKQAYVIHCPLSIRPHRLHSVHRYGLLLHMTHVV